MPRIERKIAVSAEPKRVYQALTREADRWWALGAEPTPEVGALQRMGPGRDAMSLRVLHLAPAERAAWRVEGSANPAELGGVLSVILRRSGGGSTVALSLEGLREDVSPGFMRAEAAWSRRLQSLKGWLERGAGQPE